MNSPTPDQNEWGHDPLSAEIDTQIAAMPDRPPILLAIITFNKSPEDTGFRALGPYKQHYLRELPYVIYGVKSCATLFAFEKEDVAALGGTICALSATNIDEAVLYLDGTPSLRVTKLKLKTPPPKSGFIS